METTVFSRGDYFLNKNTILPRYSSLEEALEDVAYCKEHKQVKQTMLDNHKNILYFDETIKSREFKRVVFDDMCVVVNWRQASAGSWVLMDDGAVTICIRTLNITPKPPAKKVSHLICLPHGVFVANNETAICINKVKLTYFYLGNKFKEDFPGFNEYDSRKNKFTKGHANYITFYILNLMEGMKHLQAMEKAWFAVYAVPKWWNKNVNFTNQLKQTMLRFMEHEEAKKIFSRWAMANTSQKKAFEDAGLDRELIADKLADAIKTLKPTSPNYIAAIRMVSDTLDKIEEQERKENEKESKQGPRFGTQNVTLPTNIPAAMLPPSTDEVVLSQGAQRPEPALSSDEVSSGEFAEFDEIDL